MKQSFKWDWYALGLLGCGLLLLGIFSPIITFIRGPNADEAGITVITKPITYYYLDVQTGSGDGMFMAIVVLGSLFAIHAERKRWLIFTAGIAICLLALEAVHLWLAVNRYPDISRIITVQWDYGWLILTVGVALVLMAGLYPTQKRKA